MPFGTGRRIRITALELRHISLPFRLTGKGGQTRHISFPIKLIHRVANHEQIPSFTVNLHIDDAHLALASDYLWPYVGVGFAIFSDFLFVID